MFPYRCRECKCNMLDPSNHADLISLCVRCQLAFDNSRPPSANRLEHSPATEAAQVQCANCHGTGKWWNTVYARYEQCHACPAPSATPARVAGTCPHSAIGRCTDCIKAAPAPVGEPAPTCRTCNDTGEYTYALGEDAIRCPDCAPTTDASAGSEAEQRISELVQERDQLRADRDRAIAERDEARATIVTMRSIRADLEDKVRLTEEREARADAARSSLATVERDRDEARRQLEGMTGERNDERVIAMGWESKYENAQARVGELEAALKKVYPAVKKAFVESVDGRPMNVVPPSAQVRIKGVMRDIIDTVMSGKRNE